MKKALATISAATALFAMGTAMAPSASANSFTRTWRGGVINYSDSGDRICVHGVGGYSASVTLKAISRSGPSVTVTDHPGGAYWTCSSRLMYAYEDTKYSYRGVSFTNELIGGAVTGTFYS